MALWRLWAHRGLALGLVMGISLGVAAMATVPLFAATALQGMLNEELAAMGTPAPVSVHFAYVARPNIKVGLQQFLAADRIARDQAERMIGLPVDPFVRFGMLEASNAHPVDKTRANPDLDRYLSLTFQSDLLEHITLVGGRLPQPGWAADGVLEAIVEEDAIEKQDFSLGAEFRLTSVSGDSRFPIQPRVVGVFRRTNPSDPYWFQTQPFDRHLIVPEETFQAVLRADQIQPAQISWYFGLDEQHLHAGDVSRLSEALYTLESRLAQALPSTTLFDGPMPLLARFAGQGRELRFLLLVLSISPVVITIYYVVVTTGLLVDAHRHELAVLHSRGASWLQLISTYLVEGLTLASMGAIVGYPLALFLSRCLALVSGFLQLVNRPVPWVNPPAEYWWYGGLTAALSVIAYVGSAAYASGRSIVAHQRSIGRASRRLDWVLVGLGVAGVLLAVYSHMKLSSRTTGAVTASTTVLSEPLLFAAPVLLIFGVGLICSLLLPGAINHSARWLARWLGPSLMLALVNLGRFHQRYLPFILLFTVTTGVGLYSAGAARTLDRNLTDRVRHSVGADLILEEVWEHRVEGAETIYVAPPWELHQDLPGVENAARVRLQTITASVGGRTQLKGTLMALHPLEFGQVTWFRRDLLPFHINAYLNLLAMDDQAVLVHQTFLERYRLSPGDTISILGEDGREAVMTVYGAIGHWPGTDSRQTDLFIANLDYVEEELGLRPYSVWLRRQPTAGLQAIADTLKSRGIQPTYMRDVHQEMVRIRRSPFVLGVQGGLTGSFVVVALLTVTSFLLHIAVRLQTHQMQFGFLRALGMTPADLIRTVMTEQTIAMGLAMVAGSLLGVLAASLYLPFLEGIGMGEYGPLPFLITIERLDMIRVYLLLSLALLVGLSMTVIFLRSVQVHQVLKLGEDR